jgi:hypothetical protein
MNNINEVEIAASSLFAALRHVSLSPELEEIRDYLFPDGMTPVVQLEEDGRKKRSSAAAWNWNPKSGEIRIFLEPVEAPGPVDSFARTADSVAATQAVTPSAIAAPVTPSALDNPPDRITPDEVIECCQALAAAEKSNRQFIALKWFRDSYLATVDFSWARSSQRRQRVLSEAIDLGRIDAKKIANPKSEFPTMTISLNRSMPIPGVAPRFQPVTVRGEAVSAALLRDRGSI